MARFCCWMPIGLLRAAFPQRFTQESTRRAHRHTPTRGFQQDTALDSSPANRPVSVKANSMQVASGGRRDSGSSRSADRGARTPPPGWREEELQQQPDWMAHSPVH